jgi:D-alanyl-D-alanine carboxypeptidase (penicillin-binding protein 5/6)
VALMNRTARRLALEHTHYANPIGFDAPGNYSSASDLAELADRLLENPLFARIVRSPAATLRSGDVPRSFNNRNTLLLSRPDLVVGVKTGYTIGAGYVLVAAARRGGATLISAVLGAGSESARDAESLELLQYGLSLYRTRSAVERGEELAEAELEYRGEELPLVAGRSVSVTTRRGQRVRIEVDAPDQVAGSVERGEVLGRVLVTVDGRPDASSPLIAAEAASAATLGDKALYFATLPWTLIPAGLIVIVIGVWIATRGRREAPEGDQPEPEAGTEPPSAPAGAERRTAARETESAPPQQPSRRMPGEGPAQRTPEERRRMHDERMRRRRDMGR